MANSEAGTSSDAARASRGEYQVFLSFKGSDTRHGFTDFLYHGLLDAGIRVFKEDDELRVGEVLGENLVHAINNSILYIPIFSRTYAFSIWCLQELALIADNVSKSQDKKSIFPIFLDVEPDDVKLKTPLYRTAFEKHKKDFPEKVEVWRKALVAVDKIGGWNVKKDQSQATIVKLVVEKVLEKLEIKWKPVTEHLVGLDDRVKHLTELLDVDHRDVRLIGIYGKGGIGKTTVAKVIFNKLSSHFGKCCSFLENVRESSLTKEGIVQLQRKLLSDIVGYGSAKQLMDSEQAMRRIGDALSTKKVLVVLDDVDKKEHIKRLIGGYSLHSGSRIIITTRNNIVWNIKGLKDEILWYEMLKMDDGLALRLFCQHAFGREFPLDDYHGLSSKIVSNTGGLPLLVEVIGSLLNGKDKAFWKEMLVRLREVPEEDILEMLRISYDNLDKYQQQIFLDIACFLFSENKTDAIYMWADCNIYPIKGLKVLIDRCLIKILDNDKIWMHDQLIDLGRHMVRQESPFNPGKRSRLWIAKEALEIIRTKKRKDEVQALKIFRSGDSIEITDEDFERLQNLRFLELNWGTYAGDFARCHSNLRWFSWHSPRDFRANNMYLDHLVVCKLDAIDFKDDSKAWDLIKRAQNLKVLYVTRCSGIKTIPDFSKCSRLERLTLANCFSLERIESFIGDLGSLIELKIKECTGITDLPEEVGALVKLKHFSLSGCRGLRELPSSLGNLTSLTEFDLSGTIIRELPNSIVKLKSLRVLRLPIGALVYQEDHVWQLPSGIGTLVNLEELDLSRRNVIGEIPVGIGELSSLRILKLEHTRICRIPTTINMLHHLQTLNLRSCHEIQVLPELPTSLTCLLLRSESLLSVPNLSNLTNLVELLLSNDSSLGKKSNLFPGCNLRWIGRLHKLKKLELDLLNVPAPPELASLSHLEELKLSCLDVETLMQHPLSLWSLRNLSNLEFYSCEVEDIPLDRLSQLKELTVCGCKRLQKLSIPLELRKLGQVRVSYCSELVEIQVECLSKSLESLKVYECESLTKIGGLSYSMNLEYLRIQRCKQLTNVEGLNELDSLKYLEVIQCPSLGRLIDASCTNIPDDCLVKIQGCGDFFKDSTPSDPLGMPLLRYVQEILLNTSNFESESDKTETEGGKKATAWWEKFRIWRTGKESSTKEKEKVKEKETEGGERATAWRTSEESGNQGMEQELQELLELFLGMLSDNDVQEVLELFLRTPSKYYKCDFDEESKGDRDGNNHNDIEVEKERGDEEAKEEDGAEFDISGSDEVSYSSFVGQSETDGTFSIDDVQSEPSNKSLEPSNKSLEATENRRQMRDERIGCYDSVDGGKTASMENRKKDKNEIGEPTNPSDVVRSSYLTCEGLVQYERSCEVAIEIEDQKALPFMNLPFTIDFSLKIKLLGGVFSVTRRQKKDVTPNSVTYEGLIADIKGFGFLMKRMWYRTPDEDCELLTEIKSNEQVKRMVQLASKRGSIRLIVEGGVDISLEGAIIRASQWGSTLHFLAFFFSVAFFLFLSLLRGKLDFPRKIRQLAGMRGFSLCEDSVVIFIFLLFLYFGFKYLGKVQPEILNEGQKDWALWQCQWRENYGSVNGGKTASMEDRKKDKDV